MSHQSAADVYQIVAGSAVLGVIGWWLPPRFVLKNEHYLLAIPLAGVGALIALLILSFPVGVLVDGSTHPNPDVTFLGALGLATGTGFEMASAGVLTITARCMWMVAQRLISKVRVAHE